VPTPVAVLGEHAAAGGVAFASGSVLVAEWAKGKVLRVSLSSGSSHKGVVTTFVAGLTSPLPVASDSGAVLVGDWATGTIYRVTGA
jgi:glucose/arabinose dehydrogenase